MKKIGRCPHCGGPVEVAVIGGVHHYLCQNMDCLATITFGGSKCVGVYDGQRVFEAENHLERYNRRAHERKRKKE